MSDTPQRIIDKSGHGYYHQMLNMDDDDLDVYEYRLLGHYRRVCGEFNAPCNESTRQTAEKTHMSPAQVSDVRKRLTVLGRISLTTGKQGVIIVEIEDLWAENIERYSKKKRAYSEQSKRSPGEQLQSPDCSPHEQAKVVECSPHEQLSDEDCSPGEQPKEQIRTTTSQNQEQTSSPSSMLGITANAGEGQNSENPKSDGDDDGKSTRIPEDCKSFLEKLQGDLGAKVRGLPVEDQIAWWYQVRDGRNPPGLLASQIAKPGAEPTPYSRRLAREALQRLQDLNDLATAASESAGRVPVQASAMSRADARAWEAANWDPRVLMGYQDPFASRVET